MQFASLRLEAETAGVILIESINFKLNLKNKKNISICLGKKYIKLIPQLIYDTNEFHRSDSSSYLQAKPLLYYICFTIYIYICFHADIFVSFGTCCLFMSENVKITPNIKESFKTKQRCFYCRIFVLDLFHVNVQSLLLFTSYNLYTSTFVCLHCLYVSLAFTSIG